MIHTFLLANVRFLDGVYLTPSFRLVSYTEDIY